MPASLLLPPQSRSRGTPPPRRPHATRRAPAAFSVAMREGRGAACVAGRDGRCAGRIHDGVSASSDSGSHGSAAGHGVIPTPLTLRLAPRGSAVVSPPAPPHEQRLGLCKAAWTRDGRCARRRVGRGWERSAAAGGIWWVPMAGGRRLAQTPTLQRRHGRRTNIFALSFITTDFCHVRGDIMGGRGG